MKKLAVILLGACVLVAIPAAADDVAIGSQPQCGEMVQDCFRSAGMKRSNCFYSSAKHPFCEGTELGKLIYKRWALSANTTVGGQTPPGLLGPSIYEEGCVSKIDNKLLSFLVKGNVSPAMIKQMHTDFDSCKQDHNLEVIRP